MLCRNNRSRADRHSLNPEYFVVTRDKKKNVIQAQILIRNSSESDRKKTSSSNGMVCRNVFDYISQQMVIAKMGP